jgi:ABC-type spermidine/putrescine transport system permease subunit I
MLVGIVPQFTLKNYVELLTNPTTWTLYLSTAKFTLIVLVITFVLGFWIAYFLVFHVRNLLTAIGLFLVCTVPFWTSNIIRMISWIPFLGRNGIFNQALMGAGITHEPLGVVANISAWNYPYFVGCNVIVPALLTGNALLYKPSEYAALSGLHVTRLLHEAGVPKGVMQALVGAGH